MKKRLLTAIIILSAFAANAQWINQNVPLVYEGYMDRVEAVNANTAWGTTISVAAGTGTQTRDFVRTIDGGTTWTKGVVNCTPTTLRTSNIYPLDDTTAYVSMFFPTSAGGKVYKTTDGGTNWTQVGSNMFTGLTAFADFVYFWNAQNGIAMGDPVGPTAATGKYDIYLTTDSGATWVAVPPANLPAITDPAEFGITNLYDAIDGYIWFGTTYGDVYRSTDGGNNWTKSATGLPANNLTGGGRQDISVVAFTDSLNGLVVQASAGGNFIVSTNDGGLTWTTITPTGNFFSGDVTGVPGKDIFVSAGSSATGGFGTSFSLDNGLTWNDIDGGSHTSIDFADSVTGFSGEYILAAAATGGAWKFNGLLEVVNCGSPLVSAGTGAVNDSLVCFNDTLVFSVSNAVAPIDGATHGFAVIVSTADISGNPDPLSDPSVVGGTGVIATGTNVTLTNDGSIFLAGIYYFTSVVFGNATGTGNITTITLDPTCTTTGTSVMVNLLNAGDTLCPGSVVACGSPLISAGTPSANDPLVCFNDTLVFSVAGAKAPTDGTTHGFSVIVSDGDLGGSNDPLNVAGVTYIGGTGVIPVPNDPFITTLVNTGSPFPAGIYYFTPVVYGNATGTGTVTSLTFDPACTTTGASVMINLLVAGDPLCTNAIPEITSSQFNISAFFNNDKNIDVTINSILNGKTNVTIYDITGRNVFATSFNVINGLNHEVINVGHLGAGTYIIKAITGDAQATSKLMKF
ncbi:MAG: T9SS type A sorting domain-containing protein [Bacteroidia bacterium]